jgi:hypothetical protein
VVVEVTMNDPFGSAADLCEEGSGKGHELTALLLGSIEPALDVRPYWPEGRLCGPPQAPSNLGRDLRSLGVGEFGQVAAGKHSLFEERAAGLSQEANGALPVPQPKSITFVHRLVVATPWHLDDRAILRRCDIRDIRVCERQLQLDIPVLGAPQRDPLLFCEINLRHDLWAHGPSIGMQSTALEGAEPLSTGRR